MSYCRGRIRYQPAYKPGFARFPKENYKQAGELRKLLERGESPSNILDSANRHCDNKCTEPTNLSTLLFCHEECPVWKIKNEIIGKDKAKL